MCVCQLFGYQVTPVTSYWLYVTLVVSVETIDKEVIVLENQGKSVRQGWC
jgi:hypothetical protein